MTFCPHCGAETQQGDTFCRTCGKNMTQAAIAVLPSKDSEPPVDAKTQRIGREEIVGLVVFGLLAISGFLPWSQTYRDLQVTSLTGFQVSNGEPGMINLLLSVLGICTILLAGKWTGPLCLLSGSLASAYALTTSTQLYARILLYDIRGVGVSLAMWSGFLIFLYGVGLMIKEEASKPAHVLRKSAKSRRH